MKATARVSSATDSSRMTQPVPVCKRELLALVERSLRHRTTPPLVHKGAHSGQPNAAEPDRAAQVALPPVLHGRIARFRKPRSQLFDQVETHTRLHDPDRSGRRLDRGVSVLAAGYAGALVVLSLVHALAPQRSGLLALSQILAPHLFAVLVLAIPFAFRRHAWVLRVVIGLAVLIGVVRFGDGVVSVPRTASSGALNVRALSWNLEFGQVRGTDLLAVLGAADADIVALQELTPELGALVATDPALRRRFPHQHLVPRPGVRGIGLLSAYPIVECESGTRPEMVFVRLDVGGRVLNVLNAHPLPARMPALGGVVVGFDAERRDRDLRRLRDRLEVPLSRQELVLVLGDYNVTDREPAYLDFVTGLRDAHREVGFGTGSSWRPGVLEQLPFGLLRIDYVFSGPRLDPVRLSTDCTPRGSDHCILWAEFALR